MAKSFTVEQPMKDVHSRVVQIVTAKGGTLTAQADDMIAAAFTGRPNILLVLILLVLGIIPGILYWLWAKRTKSLLVQLSGTDTHTGVTITSGGKVADDAMKAIVGAFGQKVSQKMAASAVAGTVAAAKGAGHAAASVSQSVSEKVKEAASAKAEGAARGDDLSSE